MKKIGILGSRELACKITEWLINQNKVEIVGIVAPPFKGWWNDNMEETAKANGIDVFETIDDLISTQPEIIFSINYWKIIDEEHIKAVKGGIINIHHSYLLKYRGRYSTSWAIINARQLNCWIHGTTLHYITKELDNGPILASYQCSIEEDDTAETLFAKVEELAFTMFKENVFKILNNETISFLEPDSSCFYYDKDSNKNLEIKYGTPLEEIYDFVRAWSFKDRPKPYFKLTDKKIFLTV
ncbi:MAG: formyltransferase family protein [Deltaproteobacteria bacterium]